VVISCKHACIAVVVRAGPGRGGGAGIGVAAPEFSAGRGDVYSVPGAVGVSLTAERVQTFPGPPRWTAARSPRSGIGAWGGSPLQLAGFACHLIQYRTGSMTPHSIKGAGLDVTRWLEVGTAQGAEAAAKVWCRVAAPPRCDLSLVQYRTGRGGRRNVGQLLLNSVFGK